MKITNLTEQDLLNISNEAEMREVMKQLPQLKNENFALFEKITAQLNNNQNFKNFLEKESQLLGGIKSFWDKSDKEENRKQEEINAISYAEQKRKVTEILSSTSSKNNSESSYNAARYERYSSASFYNNLWSQFNLTASMLTMEQINTVRNLNIQAENLFEKSEALKHVSKEKREVYITEQTKEIGAVIAFKNGKINEEQVKTQITSTENKKVEAVVYSPIKSLEDMVKSRDAIKATNKQDQLLNEAIKKEDGNLAEFQKKERAEATDTINHAAKLIEDYKAGKDLDPENIKYALSGALYDKDMPEHKKEALITLFRNPEFLEKVLSNPETKKEFENILYYSGVNKSANTIKFIEDITKDNPRAVKLLEDNEISKEGVINRVIINHNKLSPENKLKVTPENREIIEKYRNQTGDNELQNIEKENDVENKKNESSYEGKENLNPVGKMAYESGFSNRQDMKTVKEDIAEQMEKTPNNQYTKEQGVSV